MAEWPEPTIDPETEPPRWWNTGTVLGLLAAGLVFWAVTSLDDASPWRLPEFELPEIALNDIDFFGRTEPELRGPTTVDGADIPPSPMIAAPTEIDGAIVQPADFGMCLGTIAQVAQTLGQPAVLEDNADRRVVRFKSPEGAMVVTCSRRDGTMTIRQGE